MVETCYKNTYYKQNSCIDSSLFLYFVSNTMEWWIKTLHKLNLHQHHQSYISWLHFRPTGFIFLLIYHHSSVNLITKYELNHTIINFLLPLVPVQYDHKNFCYVVSMFRVYARNHFPLNMILLLNTVTIKNLSETDAFSLSFLKCNHKDPTNITSE